ncbi:hypothetical protein N8D56_19795 [Devosia sp. A8/3-2]|nr:hypothetical protein N8D56_19795 [Devosia sp. A8/3-2]
MLTFTLDTNCIIDLEEGRPQAASVRALADAHAMGAAEVALAKKASARLLQTRLRSQEAIIHTDGAVNLIIDWGVAALADCGCTGIRLACAQGQTIVGFNVEGEMGLVEAASASTRSGKL